MKSENHVYLAISRKAVNDAVDRSHGAVDFPIGSPRGTNDYFILAIPDTQEDDNTPTATQHPLHRLTDKDSRIARQYISLRVSAISTNYMTALNVTQPEFELCKRLGDVRDVDTIEELTESFRAIQGAQRSVHTTQRKLLSLDAVAEEVARFREDWKRKHRNPPVIGFTSGVFDIPHANHTRFLDAAREECDFLVAAIASDRTVKEQKGPERPFVTENHRAAHIAGAESVEAVVISDETFHENLLSRIRPNVMFKGDDYRGKQIVGAPEGCEVKIIEVNDPLHSSSIVGAIRGGADLPPYNRSSFEFVV